MVTVDLRVVIFSYNRGAWLENCVQSVRSHIPFARLAVFDDNSTDAQTVQYLALLSDDVEVIRNAGDGESRHGGLYANMQAALASTECRLLLTLQDDTQIVRPVQRDEITDIADLFDRSAAAFCSVLFAQGRSARRAAPRCEPIGSMRYFVQFNSAVVSPRPLAYRDVSVSDAQKLRREGWVYSGSETENATRARGRYGAMPMMSDPFVAFVPEVPTFRSRRQTFGARIAERLLGAEVKPFQAMSADAVAAMRAVEPPQPATAERHLRPLDPGVRPPFEPNAVNVFGWTRAIDKVEVWLRKWI